VLAAFFPGKAGDLAAMAEEAALSRLYGGIHYETDNEVGLAVGQRVGRVAVRAYHVEAPPLLRKGRPDPKGRVAEEPLGFSGPAAVQPTRPRSPAPDGSFGRVSAEVWHPGT
jgi:hypothetical protein